MDDSKLFSSLFVERLVLALFLSATLLIYLNARAESEAPRFHQSQTSPKVFLCSHGNEQFVLTGGR